MLFLTGAVLGCYNLIRTWLARPRPYDEPIQEAAALEKAWKAPAESPAPLRSDDAHFPKFVYTIDRFMHAGWHRRWEALPVLFTVWVVIAVVVASLFEIIPTFLIKSNVPTIASVTPYTPLELVGRDIYISEGCYNCHSQMVRPMRAETERYGDYSKAGEFVYDRPFQWGSRRIGPDLHRVGGKYPNLWHLRHMREPAEVTANSIMPPYPWMLEKPIDFEAIQSRVDAMAMLGVAYGDAIDAAPEMARAQAAVIADEIESQGGPPAAELEDQQVVALIAYLQRLGTDISKPVEVPAEEAPAIAAEPPAAGGAVAGASGP